jgi:membrane associated rhomboid family serine protease
MRRGQKIKAMNTIGKLALLFVIMWIVVPNISSLGTSTYPIVSETFDFFDGLFTDLNANVGAYAFIVGAGVAAYYFLIYKPKARR